MTSKEFDYIYQRLAKVLNRTDEDVYIEYLPLQAEVAVTDNPVPWAKRTELAYRPVTEGESWGEDWQSGWFRLTAAIPAEWAGKDVCLRLALGGEGLLFSDNGVPRWSFTCGSFFDWNYRKELFILPETFQGGEKVEFWVEGAANRLFGIAPFEECHTTREPFPAGKHSTRIDYIRLAIFNKELWLFRLEFETLFSLMEFYGPEDYRSKRLLSILNRACNVLKGNGANAADARKVLQEALKWKALSSALSTTVVGHAHIDIAWMWPVRESIRKSARTFASQLRLMEKYPDYVFGASQPQLYKFVQDNYPELFGEIRQRVREGRWELQGGMWVECDCNVPSGESLVRQFIHGKNYFMDNFGVDVRNLWIPDVFGYAASLPQIIKKSGCDFFLTQKISWNRINHFPYHTFRWRGIDGTEVVTHFPPENTYNSALAAGPMAAAQARYEQNDLCDEFLTLFGIGDGGGGPKEEYLERGLLCRDLEGAPKVRFGTAQSFFDRILASDTAKLPCWAGELYLEIHRGTLTTQGRTKRGNRKLEQLMAAAEMICSCLSPAKYPRREFDRVWKCILTNQFHDIIPGSSIHKVYDTTEAEHAQCIEEVTALTNAAVREVLTSDDRAALFFNTLPGDYKRPLEMPARWGKAAVTDASGAPVVAQLESDGTLVAAVKVAAGEGVVLRRNDAVEAMATRNDNILLLENELVRYSFNENGQMLSAIWKEDGRELLAAPANVLGYYVDYPAANDAWDVDSWYREMLIETATATEPAVRECGPVRSVLHFRLRVGNSTISQKISLAADSPSLEFDTRVSWHEDRKMLRVSFPTTICTDEASYDIQYGCLRRPTHSNTSWDAAKFEACGQRYVDLSDNHFGIALMNDCKYGHYIKENVIDLNLLRSPKQPDYWADLGDHHFTYAFMPHAGSLNESAVYGEAAQLNRAPWCFDGLCGTLGAPVAVSGEGISLEVVKRAEKDDRLVLRIVETRGNHTTGTLHLADSLKDAPVAVTDLLEWNEVEKLAVTAGNDCKLTLKPFEILTICIG